MKVILEIDGDSETFQKAFNSMDDKFDIVDSILWQMDYDPEHVGYHMTEHGDIRITVEE